MADEQLNRIAEALTRYGLHALRHFFASWAIERGFTPKRLQALLGHSSIYAAGATLRDARYQYQPECR